MKSARAATVLAALVLLLGPAGRTARAQTPVHTGGTPDSVTVDLSAIDSLEARGAAPAPMVPDTARKLPHERRGGKFETPAWVMMRSLAVPGWGQAHNRAWFKAAAVAVGEGWLIARLVGDERTLSDLKREIDRAQSTGDEQAYDAAIVAHNARLDDSNRRRWFLGAVLAYALLDAYVDAHFVDFDVEFQKADPAVPGSRPKVGGRLKVRWSF